MIFSILQMTLPVLVAFGLGYLCKRRRIFGEAGLAGLKAVVGKITLPAVLFLAYFTADYSGTIALLSGAVFLSCVLGLGLGFLLRRLGRPFGKYLPFLLTEFEAGMLGYALFNLLYPGQTPVFAMVDIGQTFCTFTVFLAALKAVSGERVTARALVGNMLHNVVFVAIVLGAVLGALGVGQWAMGTRAGLILGDVLSFLAAPTSALILIIVGYELNFSKPLIVPVLKTAGLRLAVMALLLAAVSLAVFSVVPFDKTLFAAMLLAYSLPAPFIIPLYVSEEPGHMAYISTSLSVQTLVTIALFFGIAAYSLA